MNKYKIISIVLALAFIVALVRSLAFSGEAAAPTDKAVFDNIMTRTSVREYADRPVRRTLLDSLARAGMAAPTALDMRPWKYVIVDDKQTLQTLGNNLPYAGFAAQAPAVIVVCGDTAVVDKQGRSSRFWVEDCSAATENILLAAHGFGLGAVWTAVYPNEELVDKVADILSLPDNAIPLNVIVVGYPKAPSTPKDKFKKENIHYNTW